MQDVSIWDDHTELVLGDQQTVKAGTLNAIIKRLTSDTQYGIHILIRSHIGLTFSRYEVLIRIYYNISIIHNAMESARKAYAEVCLLPNSIPQL